MNTADTPSPVSTPWWADKYISDPFLVPETALARAAGDARPPACMVWSDETCRYAMKLQPARETIAKLRAQIETLEAQYAADQEAFTNFNRLYESYPEAQAYEKAQQAAYLARIKLRIVKP